MVCKTLGLLLFGKMVKNYLKDTGDDDKWFARHPTLGLLFFGKMVLRDYNIWFARHHPLGFIEFGKMVKIRR